MRSARLSVGMYRQPATALASSWSHCGRCGGADWLTRMLSAAARPGREFLRMVRGRTAPTKIPAWGKPLARPFSVLSG